MIYLLTLQDASSSSSWYIFVIIFDLMHTDVSVHRAIFESRWWQSPTRKDTRWIWEKLESPCHTRVRSKTGVSPRKLNFAHSSAPA